MDDESSRNFRRLPERPPSDEDAAAAFKALAHPARIAILRRLSRCDQCICGELVQRLPLSQSTVSEHLRILRQGGLVRARPHGTRRSYCLDRHGLERAGRLVADLLHSGTC